jgi:phosphate transport system substrate-binding protein
MVTINQNLKRGFEAQFPGSTVTAQSEGSEKGIQDLLAGSTDIAAVSRPLSPQEQSQGLVAQPIAADQIAVVVGKANPFQGGLTSAQVSDIFQGKTTNWSLVGGPAGQIRVINRPTVSGTHQAFKELVLKGSNFGTTPNITTLPRDETTGLLQQLKTDGIGYATYAQVAKQQTVRVVPINGILPGPPNYPLQRQLYYLYKNPPSPAVQAFLSYTTSPQGQQAMFAGN